MKKRISFVIPAACVAMLFALYCTDYDFNLTPEDFEQWSNWTITSATCVAAGDSTRTCTGIGCPVASEKRPIPKLTTHTLDDNWVVTTPATCVAAGQSTRTCTVSGCSHSEDKEIPKLTTHTFGNWAITPATCVAAGNSTRTCTAVGCSHSENETIPQFNDCGTPDDPVVHGGETYQTVKIGSQVWMTRNLNYAGSGNTQIGVCYDNEDEHCNTYGRLYTWAEAMDIASFFNTTLWGMSDVRHQGVCPAGWHLPSSDEWDALATAVGGVYDGESYWEYAGAKLKDAAGWNDGGDGTNAYGFSALPGGIRLNTDNNFYNVGAYGYWWVTTQSNAVDAWVRFMGYNGAYVMSGYDYKSSAFSVRCIKD